MTVAQKVKKIEKKVNTGQNRRFFRYGLYFLLGLVFSLGTVFGGLHPFGIAVTAVSKKRCFLFTAAGAVIGSLLGETDAEAARYLCAVVLAAVGALACAAFDFGFSPAFSMGISFIACCSTGCVLAVRTEAAMPVYLGVLGESLLAAGGAFFFYRALHANYKRVRLRALPVSDITCLLISLSLLLMNLSALTVFLLNPAVIAASLAVLCTVYYFGERLGVIAALAFGFAISIGGEERLFTVGAFAFSALTASLLIPLKRFGTGFTFLLCIAFFSLAANNDFSPVLFLGCALGTLGFLLLPRAVTVRLEQLHDNGRVPSPDGALRQSLVLKLRFASSAMAAISESVEQVREKINEITQKNNEKRRGEMSESDYLRQEIIAEKTNQLRSVASDQFYSIAGMLEDLAFEFDEAEIFDSSASAKIRRLLGERDMEALNISAIEDKFGRMRVEILLESEVADTDDPRLTAEIGKACNRYFDKGKLTRFKEETMLSFSEKPSYRLSVGFAQHGAKGKLCGDTVKILSDSKGHSILIISDGMGRGSRAALDGAMGAGLLSRLLYAGFGFDSALKIVNSALLVKSNDESLATLDVANIDLFTGKCELYKAGAPASYLLHGGEVTECELHSMPAGILRGVEFARRTEVLHPDDCIVLMSDGISEPDSAWLLPCLQNVSELPPQEAADAVLAEALTHSNARTADDMSIIVARLERNI